MISLYVSVEIYWIPLGTVFKANITKTEQNSSIGKMKHLTYLQQLNATYCTSRSL